VSRVFSIVLFTKNRMPFVRDAIASAVAAAQSSLERATALGHGGERLQRLPERTIEAALE
jgi:hypothetical protein